MKMGLRIIVVCLINLVTLPLQICLMLAIVASNLTKDELDAWDEFCEESLRDTETWIKAGRFCD